jgi:hypothetical protein
MISVEASARFRASLVKANLDRTAVFSAMQLAAAGWGRPHLHGGRGIRRLRGEIFECRLDRANRLIFFPEGDRLVFDFAGNHDQVRAYLKNRR